MSSNTATAHICSITTLVIGSDLNICFVACTNKH